MPSTRRHTGSREAFTRTAFSASPPRRDSDTPGSLRLQADQQFLSEGSVVLRCRAVLYSRGPTREGPITCQGNGSSATLQRR